MNLHWEAVTPAAQGAPNLRAVLAAIHETDYAAAERLMPRFYLAGGTALALQMGHRRSIDLDFFSETDELSFHTRQEIIRRLSALRMEVIENSDGNLVCNLNGVMCGFFSYAYPLLEETLDIGGLRMASLIDIGLMKCDALITRGSRKDFYDLYFVNRRVRLEELLELSAKKYAYYRDFPMTVLTHMVQFEKADRDVQPEMVENVPWEEVRAFFLEQAVSLGHLWFGV